MFKAVDNKETATNLISQAIEKIEIFGYVDDTLKINSRKVDNKLLVEVGEEVKSTTKIPSYRYIYKLNNNDSLAKLVKKYETIKKEH